ncbi:MAG: glycoside hydrolase family 26 protein [Bacteroidales bacterium]|nr:glycoside hydrolase family 26 protein [Bacteroidales bacterium]
MKKSYKSLALLFAVIPMLFCCCSKDDTTPEKGNEDKEETVTLTMVDPNATAETKALYSNLWAIQKSGFMFGHHDDLMYGRYWYGEEGGSDTKAVCGDYPAVYSLDLAQMMDDRYSTESAMAENSLKFKLMKQAYDRGMVIICCIHINNPLTGEDSWDNSDNTVVSSILDETSDTHKKYVQWLNRLADVFQNLKGSDGKLIPIIFRPYHEHTQTWSWWGSSCTTKEEFISLWQFTVKYLRDTKGVHNLIYAISPQMDSSKTEEDFYFRWPGDDFVDFVGMDCYQGINNTVFVNNLKMITKVSENKKKPVGVTETGVEGFKATDYWTVNIHAPLTGRRVSLVVTWRNKYVSDESDKHYFSVYPGHPSEKDFVKMYKMDNTFFCNDLPQMYKMADGVTVK